MKTWQDLLYMAGGGVSTAVQFIQLPSRIFTGYCVMIGYDALVKH
jgi:hypothetical protein